MNDPAQTQHLRKKRVLYALCAVIVVIALLVALAPSRVPRPVKVAAALGDLMAAAFVWLAARQLTAKK